MVGAERGGAAGQVPLDPPDREGVASMVWGKLFAGETFDYGAAAGGEAERGGRWSGPLWRTSARAAAGTGR